MVFKIHKIYRTALKHKVMAGIGLLLLAVVSYFSYQRLAGSEEATRYVTATVSKGTLILFVSGSGQVSASNQVDVKSKVSGDVVYVAVKNGQEVKSGALLVQIDSRDALKTVHDAETSLETAKLELEQLLQPPDAYSLMQAENSLTQAQDTLTKLKFSQSADYQNALAAKDQADDDLEKAYEDAFNTVANAFLDLPTLITELHDVLYSYEIAQSDAKVSASQWNITALLNDFPQAYYDDRDEFENLTGGVKNKYSVARDRYDDNFVSYQNASRYSSKETIEALLDETLITMKEMAELVKSETNLLDFWVDAHSEHNLPIFSKVVTYQSDLKTYTSKTSSHLSSLLSAQKNFKDFKEAKTDAEWDIVETGQNQPLDLAAAERSVEEKKESLAKLQAGADELEIRAKKIAVQQKQDALSSSQQDLADHYVRAPFDGVIAQVNVKKGESISSSAVATLITKQQIAEISLNEVDVAKVKVGQKATITFDAVEELTISGEVMEVDALGAVSQGVVTYGVKIAFDTQDERVKPGMSLSAAIITDVKQDVLLVPNAAIKSDNEQYVEVLENNILSRQTVEAGLSNDMMTEIKSGLKEGDAVITQTITASANSSAAKSSVSNNRGGGMMIPGFGR